ncbi:MAG: McrC family protein [Lactobacillaceae bacterium]|jgi:5-methylcytosine-specific restriction endonuclease McrBC regulatory subunit McrC|nr:McrC family protein [Lactobacillaceae bacterium]
MSSYPLKDNSKIDNDELANSKLIKSLVNKDLSELDKENFLIFPQQLNNSKDLDRNNYIFKQSNGEVWTRNVVGIISDGEDEIRIRSRFSNDQDTDFFLRYMMETVFNYNVVNTNINSSKEFSYYDLLVFLFPYYLNQAMRKGVYKEYVNRKYNDANVRGPIDIARHLKINTPFIGKVAYNTREFSLDNSITQLIRHTIEKIQSEKFDLSSDENIKDNVRIIKSVTTSYSKMKRTDILRKNILTPVKHGYFKEYTALQKIAIQILMEEKIGFGDDDNQINGILIDVAWLWEEYIAKITGWDHYGRKQELKTLRMYKYRNSDSWQQRYPDFVTNDNLIVDTKYKKSLDKRNDYNQMITYIHLLKSKEGIFLQPTDNSEEKGYSELGELAGQGGKLSTYRFFIPQDCVNYEDFKKQIKQAELQLLNFDVNDIE